MEKGCHQNGTFYSVGTTFYKANCSEICSCVPENNTLPKIGMTFSLQCTPVKCPPGLLLKNQQKPSKFCVELTNRPETDECCSLVACSAENRTSQELEHSNQTDLEIPNEIQDESSNARDGRLADNSLNDLLDNSIPTLISDTENFDNSTLLKKDEIELESKNLKNSKNSKFKVAKLEAGKNSEVVILHSTDEEKRSNIGEYEEKSGLISDEPSSLTTIAKSDEGQSILDDELLRTLKELELKSGDSDISAKIQNNNTVESVTELSTKQRESTTETSDLFSNSSIHFDENPEHELSTIQNVVTKAEAMLESTSEAPEFVTSVSSSVSIISTSTNGSFDSNVNTTNMTVDKNAESVPELSDTKTTTEYDNDVVFTTSLTSLDQDIALLGETTVETTTTNIDRSGIGIEFIDDAEDLANVTTPVSHFLDKVPLVGSDDLMEEELEHAHVLAGKGRTSRKGMCIPI